ncbi:HK97-gp10 family putative phage morphogenesis protein [Thalassovita sp.]|uniref:HK97-gp10 family putative phage morphogenesis protein n=1 Tax=Thalassovita sp. TaxID=1979401 RepID=UPI002B27A8BC|nr:HK97-gp10 family putative phage morphogenesis protein [Thalassovita sp.]
MLQTVPEAIHQAAHEALEEGAQELVDLMRSLAPMESGALRDSIGWTWGDPPDGSIALDDLEAPQGLTERIIIYAGSKEAFYARWVEFGTQAHSIATGADISVKKNGGNQGGAMHPGAVAHPFFFPAYRALKARIRARIARKIKKAVEAL